jgi:hypothetical protein
MPDSSVDRPWLLYIQFHPPPPPTKIVILSCHSMLKITYICICRLKYNNNNDSRKTRFHHPRFRISVVLFQYHEEHQYRIRGHGRSCRAGPLSCATPPPPKKKKTSSWWATLTKSIQVRDEIERTNFESACYYSVRTLLSSRILSETPKYDFATVWYGFVTSFCTSREEHKLQVIENKVIRKCSIEVRWNYWTIYVARN